MPFIRGRYHINAIAGEALKAAREAEAALQALEHEAAQAGKRIMKAMTARANRRPIRAKGRFAVSKSKPQNWCRLIRDERGAGSWRASTGNRFNLTRAGTELCRAQQMEIPSGQATRHERDSRHCDRHRHGRCRRLEMRRVRRHMCSPTTMIWSTSCVMSLRNPPHAVSEDQCTGLPRFYLRPFRESNADVRAGARAGLE